MTTLRMHGTASQVAREVLPGALSDYVTLRLFVGVNEPVVVGRAGAVTARAPSWAGGHAGAAPHAAASSQEACSAQLGS